MKPFKTIQLIWTFYRSFFVASTLITIACLALFWKYGFSIFAGLVWFKIATLALICYFINGRKQKEYYYYHNLGLSTIFLWTTTLVFDLVLFVSLIIQLYQFK